MNGGYLFTFVQTCCLEFPFYALFLRGSWLKKIAAVVALNGFTHPCVFFLIMSYKAPLLHSLALGEAFAFSFEAWACYFFLGLKPLHAVAAAVSANLASWQLGPLFTYWLFF